MRKEDKAKQGSPGNRNKQNTYNYPSYLFRIQRFSENLGPVVRTSRCGIEWNPGSQACGCVEEAMKARGKFLIYL